MQIQIGFWTSLTPYNIHHQSYLLWSLLNNELIINKLKKMNIICSKAGTDTSANDHVASPVQLLSQC
jgi:hypothetical protein